MNIIKPGDEQNVTTNSSVNLSHVDRLKQVETSTGLKGWLYNLIGRTIKVIDDQGSVSYLHKASLLEKLCQHTKGAEIPRLSNLMVEVLNPVKGLPVTIKKVETLFKEFTETFKGAAATEDQLAEKFEQLKNRHLTVLTYKSDDLVKVLKPGDIFFKKNPENSTNIVVRAQKLFKDLVHAKITDRESYKYSHVAIYVGDGQVAESVTAQDGGVQVRLVKLEDSRFALDKEHGYQYVISRGEDEVLAGKAAAIAKSIARPALPLDAKQENKCAHKYAFANAARSLYHSSSFGLFAKQRYFKQYIDEKQHKNPLSFMSAKHFFCSNFVSFCFQTAESQTVIPEGLGITSEPPRGCTKLGAAIYRGIWSRVNRWMNICELDKQVKMKFDAKWMNPQDFRNFVVGNPKVFNDKFMFKFA